MLKLIDNPPQWPNGARCAVCFAFDLDAESLLHLYYPDDSMRRITLSSALRYGPRIAIPRLIRIFEHYGIKQTVYVPGWCVETYPEAVEQLAAAGHEIGHHDLPLGAFARGQCIGAASDGAHHQCTNR
ncbi:polysaccharide deacetylase family protein [Shinella sp.]|uniref:polysaccharide deacetylase family protein n=1 Tax=Shinella sp. TaxID=1870904 RepID=UPI00301BD31E